MNILLIEPDKILAKTYARALSIEGHNVTIEDAAQTAIHHLDKAAPDLIILELQLVKHSGIEFLYELRSYAEWQAIPVVLHTFVPADSLRLAWENLQALGVSAYLYKPQTTLQQLLNLVRTMPQAMVSQ